jgi:hypothetical protein
LKDEEGKEHYIFDESELYDDEKMGGKLDDFEILRIHTDSSIKSVNSLINRKVYSMKTINFKKGNHHLTGNDVVEYLRFRHDALGDIGRTQRQQWFLRGLLTNLKRPETVVKIPKIVSVTSKYVKTDMTPYEMTQYAALATHFDMDNIEIAMLPGAPNKTGYISYWILDPEKTQKVVDRLIYRQKTDALKDSYTASIMSLPDKKAEADKLAKALKNNGVRVLCSGSTNSVHSQFIAHSDYVTVDYYAKLKKEVPEVKSQQFVYQPDSYPCADTDFTVILAGN